MRGARWPMPGRDESGKKARERRAGLSLLEVLIALSVLSVALLGLSNAIVVSSSSNGSSREATLAVQAARQTIESLQAEDFATLFARFNADAADDPGGVVSPGSDFAVAGLAARGDDVDGMVGEILFPTLVGPLGELQLREDVVLESLGVQVDMDGDGIDEDDHAGDYRVLPIAVRIEWAGAKGPGAIELKTVIGDY